MGIYLPNVEMPTSCRECRFCNGHASTDCGVCACCGVDGKTRDAYTRQDCPLVPVPKHGRLGDLDAVEAEIREKTNEQFCVNIVHAAPTIIPAEEGEI